MAANGGGKGRGGGAPPGPPQEHPSMVPGGDEGDPPSMTSFQNARGLDSGLAKAAPSAKGLSSKTYRAYRRRLQLFSCRPNVAVEGAFLALSLLQDAAWDAAEQISLEEVEASSDPFRPIVKLLDRLMMTWKSPRAARSYSRSFPGRRARKCKPS